MNNNNLPVWRDYARFRHNFKRKTKKLSLKKLHIRKKRVSSLN